MPTPLKNEDKEHYVSRFMGSEHAQKFPEDQRAAIAYHLFESHNGEHDGPEHKGHTIHDKDCHEQAITLKGDVRFEGDGVLRYEAAVRDKPVRIDRDKNTMYGVRLMNAKPTRKDYFYGLPAQKANEQKWEQLTLGVDHDYKQGPPTVARTPGKVIKSYCDDDGTLCDIQYNPAHERMEQILKDAETGLNTISLSAITSECRQEGNCVTSFKPLGVDFVVNAGQTTKLFEQAVQMEQAAILANGCGVEVVRQEGNCVTSFKPLGVNAEDKKFEQLAAEVALLKDKLTRMEQVQPATVAASVVQMEQALVTRGVDLDAFHAEFLKSTK